MFSPFVLYCIPEYSQPRGASQTCTGTGAAIEEDQNESFGKKSLKDANAQYFREARFTGLMLRDSIKPLFAECIGLLLATVENDVSICGFAVFT